jgi:hypothetical protein
MSNLLEMLLLVPLPLGKIDVLVIGGAPADYQSNPYF